MIRLIPEFLASIFLSVNYGALLYVNSTYLESFFDSSNVSLIFLLAALLNLLFFFAAPRLLNTLGKEVLLHLFLIIIFATTLVLAFSVHGSIAALAFVFYESSMFMAYYCLDIFVEEKSLNSRTGQIRGIYYSLINAGIALGPLLLTLFTAKENLNSLYAAASLLLFVPLIVSIFLKFVGRRIYRRHGPLTLPFKSWWRKRNIRAVTLAKFALETFFGVMAIYTPIYLHGTLGFTWAELGVIFTVMLLPFVFFEWPAGEIADRYLGEKEMMSIGFFLMGVALVAMPYMPKIFWLWMTVLFISRVGASLVEIMTESYFFKKVDATDLGLMAIFRITRPAGVILGALIGALTLSVVPLQNIFFVLAFIVFWGLFEAVYLRDTL